MNGLTQEKVNECFAEMKVKWDEKVKESGHTEQMFVILDNTGFSTSFLLGYEQARQHTESLGFIMPVLIEGLNVNITE